MVFKVDNDKRILFVNAEHLKKKHQFMLNKNIIDFYSISFNDLFSDVRSGFNFYKKRGFSMVLQHQNKNLILCFNSPEASVQ